MDGLRRRDNLLGRLRASTGTVLAVDGTPDDDPAKAGRLANLGVALSARFDHFGALPETLKQIRPNGTVRSTARRVRLRASPTPRIWRASAKACSMPHRAA